METIASTILQIYKQDPDRRAVHLLFSQASDQTITYRRLIQGAAGYALALSNAGIKPGEVVIFILDHGEALISGFYGAILHGAIPSILPFLTEKLSPEQYRASLQALFDIIAPAAVITTQPFMDEVKFGVEQAHTPKVILSEQVQPVYDPDVEDLPGLLRSPGDIALLQHSSGTTGLQKGVALSHRSVFNQLNSYSKALCLRPEDVIVSWLPLYHDMGLIAGFILPILKRIPLVLMSPFDWVRAPFRLLQAVSNYHGTLTWLPNFAYNFCAQKIRSSQLESVNLASWRAIINCSEPMHWASHRMFIDRFEPFGLRPEALATCYAMAETVFAVTQGGIDSPITIDSIDGHALTAQQIAIPSTTQDALKVVSAGKPIENTHLRIIDQDGRVLPERQIGEIAIQSDCMLTGYYKRPDLTQKSFRDGWYLSGDLGYLADGEIYITGRKKDLIIVGGKNIYPQDLERLAGEAKGVHPGRVVAFGIFNEILGTEEVAIVAEIGDEDWINRHSIAEDIRQKVTRGSDIALRYLELVERGWLLKTSSGKIARSANREKFLHPQNTRTNP